MIDVGSYVDRIGADRGDPLDRLHAAHVRSVPFEDYDIQLGVPISFDLDDLHAKIVGRHRDGFCHELNGLADRFGIVLDGQWPGATRR